MPRDYPLKRPSEHPSGHSAAEPHPRRHHVRVPVGPELQCVALLPVDSEYDVPVAN